MSDIPPDLDPSILSKIKKLIRLSEHNSNENEAALAAAKAQEMLLQYNLDRSDLTEEEQTKEEPFISYYTDQTTEEHRSRGNSWLSKLAWAVAKGNLCDVVIVSNRKLCWLGRKSNIEVAQYLYETLAYDLRAIAETKWSNIRRLETDFGFEVIDNMGRPIHGKTWKNSFYMGAVEAIKERLTSTLRTMKDANPKMNALVVYNDKALQEFTHTQFPRLSHLQSSANFYGSAYMAGKNTGRNISFRTGVGAGGAHATKLLKGN